MRVSKLALGSVAAVALIAIAGSAFAADRKIGLWQITTKVSMAGMPASTRSFSSQHCMTAAEVSANKPLQTSDPSCKMINEKNTANSFSADMVCSGEIKGKGHMSVTYDSATHYTGQMTMAANAGGEAMTTTNSFEGKWVSASCGNVTH